MPNHQRIALGQGKVFSAPHLRFSSAVRRFPVETIMDANSFDYFSDAYAGCYYERHELTALASVMAEPEHTPENPDAVGASGIEPHESWKIIGLLAFAIAVLSVALLGDILWKEPSGAVVAIIVFGVLGLCAILAFGGNIRSFQVTWRGVRLKMAALEGKLKDTERKADHLEKFIFLSMPFSVYKNLRKIGRKDGRSFGHFVMNDTFGEHLRYLRDAGYITIKGPVSGLPNEGPEFSEYACTTKLGEEFIEKKELYAPTRFD
jgi:hypothetical protein